MQSRMRKDAGAAAKVCKLEPAFGCASPNAGELLQRLASMACPPLAGRSQHIDFTLEKPARRRFRMDPRLLISGRPSPHLLPWFPGTIACIKSGQSYRVSSNCTLLLQTA